MFYPGEFSSAPTCAPQIQNCALPIFPIVAFVDSWEWIFHRFLFWHKTGFANILYNKYAENFRNAWEPQSVNSERIFNKEMNDVLNYLICDLICLFSLLPSLERQKLDQYVKITDANSNFNVSTRAFVDPNQEIFSSFSYSPPSPSFSSSSSSFSSFSLSPPPSPSVFKTSLNSSGSSLNSSGSSISLSKTEKLKQVSQSSIVTSACHSTSSFTEATISSQINTNTNTKVRWNSGKIVEILKLKRNIPQIQTKNQMKQKMAQTIQKVAGRKVNEKSQNSQNSQNITQKPIKPDQQCKEQQCKKKLLPRKWKEYGQIIATVDNIQFLSKSEKWPTYFQEKPSLKKSRKCEKKALPTFKSSSKFLSTLFNPKPKINPKKTDSYREAMMDVKELRKLEKLEKLEKSQRLATLKEKTLEPKKVEKKKQKAPLSSDSLHNPTSKQQLNEEEDSLDLVTKKRTKATSSFAFASSSSSSLSSSFLSSSAIKDKEKKKSETRLVEWTPPIPLCLSLLSNSIAQSLVKTTAMKPPKHKHKTQLQLPQQLKRYENEVKVSNSQSRIQIKSPQAFENNNKQMKDSKKHNNLTMNPGFTLIHSENHVSSRIFQILKERTIHNDFVLKYQTKHGGQLYKNIQDFFTGNNDDFLLAALLARFFEIWFLNLPQIVLLFGRSLGSILDRYLILMEKKIKEANTKQKIKVKCVENLKTTVLNILNCCETILENIGLDIFLNLRYKDSQFCFFKNPKEQKEQKFNIDQNFDYETSCLNAMLTMVIYSEATENGWQNIFVKNWTTALLVVKQQFDIIKSQLLLLKPVLQNIEKHPQSDKPCRFFSFSLYKLLLNMFTQNGFMCAYWQRSLESWEVFLKHPKVATLFTRFKAKDGKNQSFHSKPPNSCPSDFKNFIAFAEFDFNKSKITPLRNISYPLWFLISLTKNWKKECECNNLTKSDLLQKKKKNLKPLEAIELENSEKFKSWITGLECRRKIKITFQENLENLENSNNRNIEKEEIPVLRMSLGILCQTNFLNLTERQMDWETAYGEQLKLEM